jgi:hypothetical protein
MQAGVLAIMAALSVLGVGAVGVGASGMMSGTAPTTTTPGCGMMGGGMGGMHGSMMGGGMNGGMHGTCDMDGMQNRTCGTQMDPSHCPCAAP